MVTRRLSLGVVLGTVTALVAASAASAAPTTYVSSTTFDFGPNSSHGGVLTADSGGFHLNDDNYSSAWDVAHPQAWTTRGNWDGRGDFSVDGEIPGDWETYLNSSDGGSTFGDCTQDANGSDITIVCPPQLMNGLSVHPELYFYSDYDLIRLVYVLDNNSGATISTNVRLYSSSECDGVGDIQASNGDVGSSSAGDSGLTTTDWNWMVQSPGDLGPRQCSVEGFVWQGTDASTVASEVDMFGDFNMTNIVFPLTIEDGTSAGFAFYWMNGWIDDGNVYPDVNDPSSPYVVSRAALVDEQKTFFANNLSTWSDLAKRGLASDLAVINFGPAPVKKSSTVELPNTGISAGVATGVTGIAVGLIAVGAMALVVIRRRAARRS